MKKEECTDFIDNATKEQKVILSFLHTYHCKIMKEALIDARPSSSGGVVLVTYGTKEVQYIYAVLPDGEVEREILITEKS